MVDLYMPRSIPNPERATLSYPENSEVSNDGVLRTTVQSGPPKLRRLGYAAATDVLSAVLYLETVQLDILLDFYLITCKKVLPFYWWDWRWPSLTDRYATYRWRTRPTYERWNDMWKVSISLDVLASYKGNFLLDFYDTEVWPTT